MKMIDTPAGNELCPLKQIALIAEVDDTNIGSICSFCEGNGSISGSGTSTKYVVTFSGDRKHKVHELYPAELAQRLRLRKQLRDAREKKIVDSPVEYDY